MQRIESSVAISLQDLRNHPIEAIGDAEDGAVAVLEDSRVVGYVMSPQAYEALMDRLEDLELARLAQARADQRPIPVDIDDL